MTRTLPRVAKHLLRAGCLIGALSFAAALPGCDESSPPPPTTTGGTPTQQQQAGQLASRGNAKNRLDQLAEEPKSLAGRSAKTAKNVADQIGNSQAQAAGMADEMSGAAAGFEVGGLVWAVPERWEKKTPSSSMRAGEFHIKGDNNETVLVTFSHFPGGPGGGDVNSNLERWKGQFRNPDTGGEPEFVKHNVRNVSGIKVHSISLVGTFKDGMPGQETTDRPNYAMRGAIVEGPKGMVFIKMTGPFEAVNATRDEWYQMIDGMAKK